MLNRVFQFPSQLRQPNASLSIPIVQHKDRASISREAIATRAYQRFIARGGAHGLDKEDWAAATEELLAEVHGR